MAGETTYEGESFFFTINPRPGVVVVEQHDGHDPRRYADGSVRRVPVIRAWCPPEARNN